MKRIIITLSLLSRCSFAQVTCEGLLGTITGAFEVATEVKMTTQIMQGGREFAYSKLRLYKNAVGEWQSEELEHRGVRRPEDSEGTEDGAEPTFDFNCEGHTVTETDKGWDLVIPETREDVPVKRWMSPSFAKLMPSCQAKSRDSSRQRFYSFRLEVVLSLSLVIGYCLLPHQVRMKIKGRQSI